MLQLSRACTALEVSVMLVAKSNTRLMRTLLAQKHAVSPRTATSCTHLQPREWSDRATHSAAFCQAADADARSCAGTSRGLRRQAEVGGGTSASCSPGMRATLLQLATLWTLQVRFAAAC